MKKRKIAQIVIALAVWGSLIGTLYAELSEEYAVEFTLPIVNNKADLGQVHFQFKDQAPLQKGDCFTIDPRRVDGVVKVRCDRLRVVEGCKREGPGHVLWDDCTLDKFYRERRTL